MLSFTEFLSESKLELSSDILDTKTATSIETHLAKNDNGRAIAAIESWYMSAIPKLRKIRQDFEKEMKRLTKKYSGKVDFSIPDIKPLKSVVSKVVKRGKSIRNLGDLVRGTITFQDEGEMQEFLSKLQRNRNVVDFDVKRHGDDTAYGYRGATHVDFKIGGIVAEIQIMTKKLYRYKSVAHDIYDKYRDSSKAPSRSDQALSMKLYHIGNRGRKMSEEIGDENITLGQLLEGVDLDDPWLFRDLTEAQ